MVADADSADRLMMRKLGVTFLLLGLLASGADLRAQKMRPGDAD